MTAIVTRTEIGSIVKPTARPSGVSAIAMAPPRVARDVAVSTRSGLLLHVHPQVLMTKMTRIWVDIDSMNQAVRNASGSA